MPEIKKTFFNFLGIVKSIKEINEKYKHPKINMTRFTSILLMFLRSYLIFILLLLLYKFISVAMD
jgi:hypothetical protein